MSSEDGQTAQQLKTLPALVEDPGSVPSPHTAANNQSVTPVPEGPIFLFWLLYYFLCHFVLSLKSRICLLQAARSDPSGYKRCEDWIRWCGPAR